MKRTFTPSTVAILLCTHQGESHRLFNPGREPLEIIEVQSGDYLGGDDIVRLEDRYRGEGEN